MYRVSVAIGDANMESGVFIGARKSYGLGLAAVKEMKKLLSQQFKGEYLDSYTTLDQINLKEAELSMRLGEAFHRGGDIDTAETLFKGTLYATKQHYAQLDLTPRVVVDMRTFVDGWVCLDSKAMLALARIEVDRGSFDKAVEWIEPARELAKSQDKAKQAPCVACYSQVLAQLGRIAERQGDQTKALRRFREAYEHARLNFASDLDRYAAEVERLSA
ncbi:hypothetical protein EC988_002645 [Linderina pennispora]|nr:hypothetical protein EC988_002645 [Linderina pennispora]